VYDRSVTSVEDKVLRLLNLAVRGEGEESRTAALAAAKLIVANRLIRSKESDQEIHDVARSLYRSFMAIAWEKRNDLDYLLTVPMVVEAGLNANLFRPEDRKQITRIVSRLVLQERKKGVLLSTRGRYGGYRMASRVVRSHAR